MMHALITFVGRGIGVLVALAILAFAFGLALRAAIWLVQPFLGNPCS